MKPESTHAAKSNLFLLWCYVKESPGLYARIIALSVVIGLLEFIGISSVLPALGSLLGESPQSFPAGVEASFGGIPPVLVILVYFGVVLLQAGLAIWNEDIFLKSMIHWRMKTGLAYVSSIINAPFAQSSRLNPGEVETTIARNLGGAVKIRYRTAVFLSDCVLAVFYVLLTIYIAFYSIALLVLLGLLFAVLNKLTLKIKIKHAQIAKDQHFIAAKHVAEHLADIRSLLISNKNVFLNTVRDTLTAAAKSERRYTQIDVVAKFIQQPVLLGFIGIGVLIARFVLAVPDSNILVMLFVFYRAAPKVIAAANGYGQVIGDSPIDIVPDIKKWTSFATGIPGTLQPADHHEICFRGVSISQGDTVLVSDLNLTIPHNSFVVITGKSGSGKSTILDVLCGFKGVDAGAVTIGGIDSRSIDYSGWLLREVGLVRQESTIVSGDVAHNIAFLEEAVDYDRVQRLIETMGIDEFLSNRDNAYAALDARGENLSAGQRQRIILARALYKNPKLLLLDEPTSNLDVKTEQDIIRVLARLKGTMTIIATSHRTGILELADQVYRLSNKALVADFMADYANIKSESNTSAS